MNELELRDIHLPTVELWWPPGPGWWWLLALVFALVLVAGWLYRRHRNPPLRRLTLRQLQSIRQKRLDGQNDRATINAVARLLRRTLISYRGRTSQAASTGTAWTGEVKRLSPRHGFDQAQLQLLARERYRQQANCDVDELLRACEDWIRHLPRKVARVSA